MTTTDNAQTQTFMDASAPKMAQLICLGTVSSVGDAHVSSSDQYIVQPIQLDALESGRSTKIQFLYRPEWLRPNFKPDSLQKLENGNAVHFVYSKNIAQKGGSSVLRGLAGSKEAFDRLAGEIFAIPATDDNEKFMQEVTAVLRNFFENNNEPDGSPKKIGYILRQTGSKVYNYDEDGNPVVNEKGQHTYNYVLEKRYQVNEFFDVTDKDIKVQLTRAQKNPNEFRVTFEEGVPF